MDRSNGGATTSKAPEGPDQGIERFLLDEVPAAVIATDPDGRITHWNRHAEELFGYSRNDATGRNLLELIVDPADRAAVQGITRCLSEQTPWAGEVATITMDGAPLPTRLRASPTTDPSGVLLRMTSVIVDVTVFKEAERRLAAQYAVTRVLAEAETLSDATPSILEAVGEGLDWEVGAIWKVDRNGGFIRCVASWQSPSATVEEFAELTRQTSFPPGAGLPGRVWSTGEAAWIPDVVLDQNFPRAVAAAQEGLHGAFAFPIVLGREILGVIEFFSTEIREPDPALVTMMSSIGSQVGQFIERKEAEEAVRESESRKSAIVEGALDCIITMDHKGNVVEFNPAAEHTFGYRSDEAIGRQLAELIIPPHLRDRHRQGLARFLVTGESALIGRRVELTGMRADGTEFPVEVTLAELPTEVEPPMFTGFIRDITDRKSGEDARARILAVEQAARETSERAQEREAFLSEASNVLAGSLDFRKTLNKVVRLAVPRLADWCSVDVLEEGEIRPVVVAHEEPEMIEAARELHRRWPTDMRATRGAPAVIRTGRSELYADIPDELLHEIATSDEHLEQLERMRLHSAMVVPLTARGRTFGAMTCVSSRSDRRYGAEDLVLAEELASRAAQAVDNARLYQERARIARALQQSLLPQRLPEIEWCQVAARYRAAGEGEVGGDFYDVFDASDGAWFAAIGDVQGKGPEAAAITGLARYTLKATATAERNPSRLLRRLNQVLLREGTDRFMTVAVCRLQPMNGYAQAAISCGGHPLPYVLRQSGEVETADCLGNLLGVFPEPDLHDFIAELQPGDALVLYTDGVIEEPVGKQVFGEGRLEALLKESTGLDAETVAGRIEQAILEARLEEPRDDFAILVLRFLPGGVAPPAEPV